MRQAALIFVVFALAILAVYGIDAVLNTLSFADPLLTADLKHIQEQQLGIYVRMTEQLLTLSTIVLGAVGGVLFGAPKTVTAELKKGLPNALWIGALFLVLSIYLGYLSYDRMVWMLSKNFFNLDTPILFWLRTTQFLSFLFGIASLVTFAYQTGRA
jgi:hypothetical protein